MLSLPFICMLFLRECGRSSRLSRSSRQPQPATATQRRSSVASVASSHQPPGATTTTTTTPAVAGTGGQQQQQQHEQLSAMDRRVLPWGTPRDEGEESGLRGGTILIHMHASHFDSRGTIHVVLDKTVLAVLTIFIGYALIDFRGLSPRAGPPSCPPLLSALSWLTTTFLPPLPQEAGASCWPGSGAPQSPMPSATPQALVASHMRGHSITDRIVMT